jgi:ketosteroid isomerase-like protein
MATAVDQIRCLLASYAPDGVFIPTTLPTVHGDDMRAAYQQIFDSIRLDVTFCVDELVVASDGLAYTLTRSSGTQTVLATNTVSTEFNRKIFIFTTVDGNWKISHYMVNKPDWRCRRHQKSAWAHQKASEAGG